MEALALDSTNTASLEKLENEFEHLALSLPNSNWLGNPMHLYQDFWCLNLNFKGIVSSQIHFQANDSDIILASLPKTGTTWLKSLVYTIVNRENLLYKEFSQHPFHTKNPHELICHLEYQLFNNIVGDQPNLTIVPLPRLFATHVSYPLLPMSIKTSKCKIVYICRNPLDTFVSSWHFFLQFEVNKETKPSKELMEEHLAKYAKGVFPYGPHDDHVLTYWKESMNNPRKVFFLEYEGLKKEPKDHLKRLANFLGYPFSDEEENKNLIDEIIELCSIKSLKEMEVNKNGQCYPWVENKALFRKGEVGDWGNYLTPSMAKQLDHIQEKLNRAGFCSMYYPYK